MQLLLIAAALAEAAPQSDIPPQLVEVQSQPGVETIQAPLLRMTQVAVVLNPAGKPERCMIKATSGSSEIDRNNCGLAMQARYSPGSKGSLPVASTWVGWVGWLIEGTNLSNTAIGSGVRKPGEFGSGRVSYVTDDYPSKALREGRQGITTFRVSVGTTGRAMTCVVIESSGHVDLDGAACQKIMLRARFKPALDSLGKPTIGWFQSKVKWLIPSK